MGEGYKDLMAGYCEARENYSKGEDLETDDFLDSLEDELLRRNSFENPLSREVAEMLMEKEHGHLDWAGGYWIQDERGFEVQGEKYSVIAYGVTARREDAIRGMVFVKESVEE